MSVKRGDPTILEIVIAALSSLILAWIVVYSAVRFIEFFQAIAR